MKTEEDFNEEHARDYDKSIKTRLPGYEVLHQTAYSFLRPDLGEKARVLVVGAGTGKEILNLGERQPGWRFTGVDPSPGMLRVARGRISGGDLSSRTELHIGFVHGLPASELYDAATLLLVMHFVPDDGGKLALLREVARRLKPGAPLVLADLHGEPNSADFTRQIEAYKIHLISGGLQPPDVEEMFRHILSKVQFVPESRILSLLCEAGFEDVVRFYQVYAYGGWAARKSRG